MRTHLLKFCVLLLLLPSAQAAQVVASIRPLAMIAVAVTGDGGSVRQLVPDGASSHDYQLRPSDRALLAGDALVLWAGPAHERFLVSVLAGRNGSTLAAQFLPGIRTLAQRTADGSGRLPGTVDPHLWLDPDNAVVVARDLARVLGRREPAAAARYRRNAEAFAARVAAVEAGNAARFGALRSRRYIAYHDAWQYLEAGLGLDYRGSLTLEAETRPGARYFLQMAERVQRYDVRCFLGEPGFDAALARRLFAGRPARLVSIDELFVDTPMGPDAYPAALATMVDRIYGCLGGH
jgi:zinc transport system substrate-binding protein